MILSYKKVIETKSYSLTVQCITQSRGASGEAGWGGSAICLSPHVHSQMILEEAQWGTWGLWTHALKNIDLKHQTTSSRCSCFTWTMPFTSLYQYPQVQPGISFSVDQAEGETSLFSPCAQDPLLQLHIRILLPSDLGYQHQALLKPLFLHIPVPVSHIQDPGTPISHREFTQTARSLVKEAWKSENSRYILQKNIHICVEDTSIGMLFVALFVIAKIWQQPKTEK